MRQGSTSRERCCQHLFNFDFWNVRFQETSVLARGRYIFTGGKISPLHQNLLLCGQWQDKAGFEGSTNLAWHWAYLTRCCTGCSSCMGYLHHTRRTCHEAHSPCSPVHCKGILGVWKATPTSIGKGRELPCSRMEHRAHLAWAHWLLHPGAWKKGPRGWSKWWSFWHLPLLHSGKGESCGMLSWEKWENGSCHQYYEVSLTSSLAAGIFKCTALLFFIAF